MFRKMKNKLNHMALSIYTSPLKAQKGDTQLIVLVLLLAVVAVAVVLFQDTFMGILKNALNNLKDIMNNLFGYK